MRDFDGYTAVKVTIVGRVALVLMCNPPVNAISRELNDQLTKVMDEISECDEILAVVLSGEGRIFCAGADIKKREQSGVEEGQLTAHLRRTRECFHAIRECAKPVVAAINGPALGAGLAIAASADILMACENTSLGLPEVDVGLLGGCRHAMRLLGHSRLRHMALTGLRVGGQELYRLGIVEVCTTAELLIPEAMNIAQSIASKSPVSTRMIKSNLNTIEELSLRDGYRFEQEMTAVISRSIDAAEAQKAFREKRAPVFVGR